MKHRQPEDWTDSARAGHSCLRVHALHRVRSLSQQIKKKENLTGESCTARLPLLDKRPPNATPRHAVPQLRRVWLLAEAIN